MYRYSVDNAVTFTSEDVVLFRESPFACWMERLTLENPDHGIAPDAGSTSPCCKTQPQDELADTLRAEGKDVRLIDWDQDEATRRRATLDAMCEGSDFIVNGQLARDSFSSPVNLLVRTSGYSDFGDFLYIPCDTQTGNSPRSAFSLCFLADLLGALQGQLPPQMFIIQGGDDLVPLPTENLIYHYRAVKRRFVEAMSEFRKHRMPDPAESSHFGRWSDCACEVLKQRLLREENQAEEAAQVQEHAYQEPMRQAVGAGAGGGHNPYDLDDTRPAAGEDADQRTLAMALTGAPATAPVQTAPLSNLTLIEQARMLKPGTYKPGPGVFRLGAPRAVRGEQSKSDTGVRKSDAATSPNAHPPTIAEDKRRYNRRASDAALQTVESFRSGERVSGIDSDSASPPPPLVGAEPAAPAPSLREPRSRTVPEADVEETKAPGSILGRETVWGLPSDTTFIENRARGRVPGTVPPELTGGHSIDMDSTHLASPGSRLTTASDKTDG